MMKFEARLLLWVMLNCVTTKFVLSRRKPDTPCEIRGTALVEQFFNIVFAEFHQSPPTCICAQMCPDQPTYCYPNGCFRGTEKKTKEKETTSVSRLHHEGAKMFLVDGNNDFFADMMGDVNSVVSTAGATERIFNYNIINPPNLFKEIIFKYKRIPKLQMKYNLREQIKNTREKKAEMDVSKIRWPTNKQIRHHYKVNHHRSSRQFASALPENNQPETSKYFKRYLTKRENQNDLDIDALYLYKDASNFSLETLIDDLIGRGLENINSTLGLKINNSSELNDEDNKGDSILMDSVSESLDTTRFFHDVYIGNQNNSIHGNTSDLIIEVTKRDHKKDNVSAANSTSFYFETITKLSKQIEKQNNSSIEVVENMTGKKFEDFPVENFTKVNNFRELANKTRNAMISDFKRSIEISGNKESTGNKVSTNIRQVFIPLVTGQANNKSKQRLVRKLRNRKHI